mgnify:CR=1 FL=1
MAVKTYDPKSVVVTVGGYPISGFADGTFITVERSSDAFTKVVGADGEVSRAKSADRSGSVTFTLMQTSNSNAVLSAFAIADENTGAGVVPILIKEGNSIVFAAEGWVRKLPNAEWGKEVGNREWVFDCAVIQMEHGGN